MSSNSAKIFAVKNTDRRQELLDSYESEDWLYVGQKPMGQEVEMFHPDVGFFLKANPTKLSLGKDYMKRVAACAKLSLQVKLELREFYYTIRQTPELVKAFEGIASDGIYPSVLNSLNDLEIVCDINRDEFTMGNLSKGFIYYRFSFTYGNPEKKIGFTENIAKSYDLEYEIQTAENIIICEKMSAANRMVELGLSELTNSVIVTAGGYFNRSIWYIISRFRNKKNIICLCDGDVYGDDMMRTVEFGTQNSAHLPYKFPPSRNPKVYFAGLFPSVGEWLGLPNDVSEKRPLNNPSALKRLKFLERYELINPLDIAAWRRNNTYELEALSAAFTNEDMEPVGLGIYALEFMRRHKINIKQPLPPDDVLKAMFDKVAWEELEREIREKVEAQSPRDQLREAMEAILTDQEDLIVNQILDKYREDYITCLAKVGAKEIKYHIYQQFKANPGQKEYDLKAIAHKLKKVFEIDINMPPDEIKEQIQNALEKYITDLSNKLWDAQVTFEAIHNETVVDQNLYDLALKHMGAKDQDIAKVRAAIERRF